MQERGPKRKWAKDGGEAEGEVVGVVTGFGRDGVVGVCNEAVGDWGVMAGVVVILVDRFP